MSIIDVSAKFRNRLDVLGISEGVTELSGDDRATIEHSADSARTEEIKNCQITIFSPVNVDVYLEDKERFVLHLVRNSGFDYEWNSIAVGKKFALFFSGKSFEKKIVFERPDDCKLEYRLYGVLTREEIEMSYDREAAIAQIRKDATAYSFEQLAATGKKEDIKFLHEWLSRKSMSVVAEDLHNNFLIAECADALGNLCIRYHSFEYAADIAKVYDRYKAKESYGYYFENILKALATAMNEASTQDHLEPFQKAEDGDPVAQ